MNIDNRGDGNDAAKAEALAAIMPGYRLVAGIPALYGVTIRVEMVPGHLVRMRVDFIRGGGVSCRALGARKTIRGE